MCFSSLLFWHVCKLSSFNPNNLRICYWSSCSLFLFYVLKLAEGFEWDGMSCYRDLSGNNLSGQLPPSMGNMLSLSTLWVSLWKNLPTNSVYAWYLLIEYCLWNVAGTCRTITLLVFLMSYRIYHYRICTLLSSFSKNPFDLRYFFNIWDTG